MKLTEKKINTELKRHNYKLTNQRRAVVVSIVTCKSQFTPALIYEKLHREHPDIGLVTVYRTLGILMDLGLVCELHASGDCPAYTVGTSQHHHHLICNRCGRVVDFTGHRLAELEKRLAKESGFRIDSHVLEFTGLCLPCQKIKC